MKARKGFSLVETIFTVSIIGFIIIVMLNILPGALTGVRKTGHRIRAGAIARSILEEKRAGPFSGIDMAPPAQVTDPDGSVYDVGYEVLTQAGTNTAKLKGIKITVSWKERKLTQTLQRITWISNIPK
ncbi:MAG: hypothetical protein RDV48_26905 [Candidatus Eremiobacteraeota bacterium]|nr:hypothetical protein [Candidatus Eremiobacteraeota bacterium]